PKPENVLLAGVGGRYSLFGMGYRTFEAQPTGCSVMCGIIDCPARNAAVERAVCDRRVGFRNNDLPLVLEKPDIALTAFQYVGLDCRELERPQLDLLRCVLYLRNEAGARPARSAALR